MTHNEGTILASVTGGILETAGSAIIPASIADPLSLKTQEFMVVPNIEEDVIIGMNILSSEKAIINFSEQTITSASRRKRFFASNKRKETPRIWSILAVIAAITALTVATLYVLTLIKNPSDEEYLPNGNLTSKFVKIPTILHVRAGKVLSERTKHIVVIEFPVPRILNQYISNSEKMILGIMHNTSKSNGTTEYQRLNAKCRIRTLHE